MACLRRPKSRRMAGKVGFVALEEFDDVLDAEFIEVEFAAFAVRMQEGIDDGE